MAMLRCDRWTLCDALAIVVLGLALGLAFNYRMVMTALTSGAEAEIVTASVPTSAPDPAPRTYPVPTMLAEVKTLLAAGAIAIDARSAELYAAGHLPGAISLPLGEAVAAETFKKRLPPGKILITYCSGYGCTDSFDLALTLISAGYSDVRVFEGGYPEWRDAGLAIGRGRP